MHMGVDAAFNLNAWRDCMPDEIGEIVLDNPVANAGSTAQAAGTLVPESSVQSA